MPPKRMTELGEVELGTHSWQRQLGVQVRQEQNHSEDDFSQVGNHEGRTFLHPPSRMSWPPWRDMMLHARQMLPVRRTGYTALVNPSGMYKRSRRCLKCLSVIWILTALIPTITIFLIVLFAVFLPSYTHPPAHYTALQRRATDSAVPGRANVLKEKIFIATSIYDNGGTLASGPWGKAVLDLIALLGPENVFLSVYENDPDPGAEAALKLFSKAITCNASVVSEHVDRSQFPRVTLPTGEKRLKRIAYLAHLRNRALTPLDDASSEAHNVTFDKLLFINDVVFDPVDAANLLFSTNVDPKTGKTRYRASCAVDFINPFKFYDTFATRDLQGRGMGIPIFPWFTHVGQAESRRDVLDQRDAVRVRSCWGGMVAFEGKWFQPDGVEQTLGVADLIVDHTSHSRSVESSINHTERAPDATSSERRGLRFRANTDTFWDASECCLIHADLQEPRNLDSSEPSGIYVNPYIRVAYSPWVLAFLPFTRRLERLFAPIQRGLSGLSSSTPYQNERRLQERGDNVTDRLWAFDDPNYNVSGNFSGHWHDVDRTAVAGGFCGLRLLLQMDGDEKRSWRNGDIPPDEGRYEGQ